MNDKPLTYLSRSRGRAEFSVGGVKVDVNSTDEEVIARAKELGLWGDLQGTTHLPRGAVTTWHRVEDDDADLEIFLWVGEAHDGGFIGYRFRGPLVEAGDLGACTLGVFRIPPMVAVTKLCRSLQTKRREKTAS